MEERSELGSELEISSEIDFQSDHVKSIMQSLPDMAQIIDKYTLYVHSSLSNLLKTSKQPPPIRTRLISDDGIIPTPPIRTQHLSKL
jgi:hypothetical protein